MAAFQNSQGEDYLPGGYVRFNGVQYELSGKTRDKPVSQEFLQKLMAAVQATDPSLQVKIVSGGQSPKGSGGKRTGSTRHDVGPDGFSSTADLVLIRDGKPVRPGDDKALYSKFLQNAAAAGFPGIGHYSWGVHVGGGKPAMWGPSTTSRDLDPDFKKAIAAGRESYTSGVRLPYADIPAQAPTPGTISPAITEKRRLFAENAASQAIEGAAPRPTVASLSYNAPTPGTAPFIPPGFDSPRGMDTSALYAGIIPKLDAATKWNDGGKGTPIQVANFDRMTDRDPYGIGSPPPVTPLPKLSAPGAGMTAQQRNAIAAVPQATERRYNPETNTWTAKQTLQPRPASNAPGQSWGVGGANQAGTTQMPRDVRPSSVPAAPARNPMLAAAVEKYEGKKAPVQGLIQVVPGRDNRTAAPVPMPYGAGDAARARVASLEPMALPAARPAMTAPMPLPRAAGDAARAKAAAQYPMVAPPAVAPIPLPYSAGVAARAKASAPVLEYSNTLKKPDAWESMLSGVDEWWQMTPAGRLGNVLAGKPQAPSRTGLPEAFMSWLDQQNKPKPQAPQAPARKSSPGIGFTLFGGGNPIFGGSAAGGRSLGVWQTLLGSSMPATGPNAGPAAFTPQGNLHPGVATASNGNDMAHMPRSYQENPRNWNGGY